MDAQDPFNFSRRIFLTEAMSIVIGFGIFLHACDNVELTKEREIMAVTKMNAVSNVAMPPIDRSSPLKTETATFGLG
jgi:hypothetical protein